MSKIEELKLKQKHLSAGLECLAKNIGCQKDALDAVEKQIAALEAEASKPREWRITTDIHGKAVVLSKLVNGWWFDELQRDGWGANSITLIEKKPVRVTLDMANKALGIFVQDKKLWLEKVLNAIGIDAIAAD